MSNRRITLDEAKANLNYDRLTGIFTRCSSRWKNRIGCIPGGVSKSGYVVFNVLGNKCRAHHIAWLFVYGEYPKGIVDHIDGSRENNAISNLRILDAAENTHNIHKAYSTNKTSGLLGSNYCKESGRYLARIMVRGKVHRLGRFHSAEDAHDAYMRAKAIWHPASVAAAAYVKEASNG